MVNYFSRRSGDIVGIQTFGEKSIVVVYQVAAEKPTVAELVISFYEFDSVAFRKTQFIRASSLEIVCMSKIFVSITSLAKKERGARRQAYVSRSGCRQPQAVEGLR